MKFKEFLVLCESGQNENEVVALVKRQFEIIHRTDKYGKKQKEAFYKRIYDSCLRNDNENIKNRVNDLYKKILEPDNGKYVNENGEKSVDVKNPDDDSETGKLEIVKKLPCDSFLNLFQESEKIFPVELYAVLEPSNGKAQPREAGKMRVKIKATGEEKELDTKMGKVLLQKGIAEKITKVEEKVNETYEAKRQRMKEKAEELFQKALSGDLHSLELLVVSLANGYKLVFDKSTTVSTVICEVLSEYSESELPLLALKLLTKDYKPKILNKYNYARQKKVEFISSHYKHKVMELIKARIPAAFRREYINTNEEIIKMKARLTQMNKELSSLKRPGVSGYSTDQKSVDKLESKIEDTNRKISELTEKLAQIDQSVEREISLIEHIDAIYSVPDIRNIVGIYKSEYFGERDNYLESKKKKSEKTKGYYSSIDDVVKNFYELLTKPETSRKNDSAKLLETCKKMVFDFTLFIKEPETMLKSTSYIYLAIRDDVTACAFIETLGKLLEFREELEAYPGYNEMNFEQFRTGIGSFLYSIVREGKGLQRVHAYAALGRLGLLSSYEHEEFWYEDYLKEFKFVSSQLLNDPLLEEYKTSLFAGVKKLNQINTKLFLSKKNLLRKSISDQITLMQTKGDQLSESIFKELSLIL